MSEGICPECHHAWGAHQGRPIPLYHRCLYRPWAGYECHCRRINPDVEAEERLAAAMWNAFMGRPAHKRTSSP